MDLISVNTETPASPVQGEAPPAEDVTSPSTTPESAENPPAEADAGAEQEGEAAAPKPRPVQKRISELVREREAAKREAEYWRHQAQIAQPAAKPADAKPAEIKSEDFQTYEDYLIAKAKAEAVATLETQMASRANAARQDAEERERQAITSEFHARAEQARERYEDFDEVVNDPAVPISPVMADAIVASNAGHEVAYFLGKNKKEAARIASLSPLAQVMEIARLEGRLTAPKRASTAPVPPRTVSGGGAPARDPSQASTFEEYRALRMQQERKAAR
jgi:hypothetical protein